MPQPHLWIFHLLSISCSYFVSLRFTIFASLRDIFHKLGFHAMILEVNGVLKLGRKLSLGGTRWWWIGATDLPRRGQQPWDFWGLWRRLERQLLSLVHPKPPKTKDFFCWENCWEVATWFFFALFNIDPDFFVVGLCHSMFQNFGVFYRCATKNRLFWGARKNFQLILRSRMMVSVILKNSPQQRCSMVVSGSPNRW